VKRLTESFAIGGLCGGIFIDELFESTCKARLGSRWRNLSPAGIKEIMKDEWENAVKPRFSIEDWTVEYIVAIPAGAFAADGAVGLNDSSTQPHIRDGRIHFRRYDKIIMLIRESFADNSHTAQTFSPPSMPPSETSMSLSIIKYQRRGRSNWQ
jgi:hypothetical protein